jgi:autotransporter-associated beta strand protein
MNQSLLLRLLATSGCLLLACTAALHAANGTWTQTASGGLWSNTANWTGGIIADGSGFTADFNTLNITANNTFSLDSNRTLTNLIFGDTTVTSAASWILNNNGNAANILTLAGTTPTITVNALGTNATTTISAEIAGTAGLRKAGAGNLILTGNNTYTGTTSITAGVVLFNSFSAFGTDTTAIQLSNGGNLTYQPSPAGNAVTNRNLNITGTGAALSNSVSGTLVTYNGDIAATGALVPRGNAGGNGLINGRITGTALIQKTDTFSTWGLTNNANSFTGDTRVFGGTLNVTTVANAGAASALGSGTNITINTNTGSTTPSVLGYNGTTNTSTNRTLTLGAGTGFIGLEVSGTGNVIYNNTAAVINLGTAATNQQKTLFLRGSSTGTGELAIAVGNAVNGTAGQLATSITKTGTGTWTLSGNNTHTGPTSVNGGTLLLGSTGAITNSPLLLTTGLTGKLGSTVNGMVTTSGTLSLGAGISVIDFGGAATNLNIADSKLATWTGTLQIWNWTGSLAGGGSDQLNFAAAGLTAAQIAAVSFVNPNGVSGNFGAEFVGNELVPVPEPHALSAAGVALLAILRRRRSQPQ